MHVPDVCTKYVSQCDLRPSFTSLIACSRKHKSVREHWQSNYYHFELSIAPLYLIRSPVESSRNPRFLETRRSDVALCVAGNVTYVPLYTIVSTGRSIHRSLSPPWKMWDGAAARVHDQRGKERSPAVHKRQKERERTPKDEAEEGNAGLIYRQYRSAVFTA